jgi:hypothetical protein
VEVFVQSEDGVVVGVLGQMVVEVIRGLDEVVDNIGVCFGFVLEIVNREGWWDKGGSCAWTR